MINIDTEHGDLFVNMEDDQLWIVEDICCWPIVAMKNMETGFVISGRIASKDLISFVALKKVPPEMLLRSIDRIARTMASLKEELSSATREVITVRQKLAAAEFKKTAAEKFVDHIAGHLAPECQVLCTICGKTVTEIAENG